MARRGTPLALAVQVAFLGAVLLLWFLSSSRAWVPELLVPPLPAVGRAIVKVVSDPQSYRHLGVTLLEFGFAMLIAMGGGMAVGVVLGTVRYLGDLFEPVVISLYSVPIILVYPLCILLFGVGIASKVVFSGMYCFFPVVLQTMKGLRHVDRQLVTAAVSMGANRGQLLVKVLIPAAFPMIATGLRVAGVLGLLSAVSGEMIAGLEGIGSRISWGANTFNIAEMYAWIVITVVLVLVVNRSLTWLEARVQT